MQCTLVLHKQHLLMMSPAEDKREGKGSKSATKDSAPSNTAHVQIFVAEFDEEGVYVYQAYCHAIADFAVKHQRFGGEDFNPHRMTWIKPSFAWVLYRSGYGHKHNQERILKIKLPHQALGEILEKCVCKHGGGGTLGRVQWDPARDLYSTEAQQKHREPRKMLRQRAIQIGMKGQLSKFYVDSVLSIEDVTLLAHQVGEAHGYSALKNRLKCRKSDKTQDNFGRVAEVHHLPRHDMQHLIESNSLPHEQQYMPLCSPFHLERLGMSPGERATAVAGLGRGMVGA